MDLASSVTAEGLMIAAGRSFFDVAAEHDIITTVIGENAILPCRLITKHLPPSMELQWRKVGPGKDKTIYLYLYDESSPLVNSYPQDDKCSMGYLSPNGINSREWLRKKYEKKAEVFKGKEFGKGNISLKLNNIQVEDEGKYICSATANSFHRGIIIEVLVIGKKGLELEKADLSNSIILSPQEPAQACPFSTAHFIALSIIVLKLPNDRICTSSIG
ncbi:perforin-1-like [Platysternon megacephalum]|uniref:Perforin-1-like n=1 Tax=Platysternon megacephalum TaxID=55544 RepID=A0A4D9DKG9_9SAUR|nr:perforin-1-like [Platysternon megacephalum]